MEQSRNTKTAILIHGSFGHPEENWFPWMKAELEKRAYEVHVPAFPTPEGQSYENWLAVFKKLVPVIGPETVLIGHSTGCVFILNALHDLDIPVKSAFLVAPFIERAGHEYMDDLNASFVEVPRDWEQIKGRSDRFVVYYSDNDPFLPAAITRHVAEMLSSEAREISGAGHFNAAAGYVSFAELIEDIVAVAG